MVSVEISLPSTPVQTRPQAARLVGVHPIKGLVPEMLGAYLDSKSGSEDKTYSFALDGGNDGLAHVAQAVAKVLEIAHPPGIFRVEVRDFFDVGSGCARSPSIMPFLLVFCYFWWGLFDLDPTCVQLRLCVLLCGRLGGGWGGQSGRHGLPEKKPPAPVIIMDRTSGSAEASCN